MNEYIEAIKQHISKIDAYDIDDYYHLEKFPRNAWKYAMQNIIADLKIDDSQSLNGLEICKCFEAIGFASNDGGLNFAIGAHVLSTAIPLSIYGSEIQKEKYLSKVLNGDIICANAITETEAGSDIFSMKASAKKRSNTYLLNANKTFCSNVREADIALVYVSTNQDKGAHGGISTFIVEKSQFTVGSMFSKMGLRTCSIGELILDNVEVADHHLLAKEGSGSGIFTTAMDWERIGLSAMYVGTMQRLFEQSLEYAKRRNQGGQNIGKYQAISHKIAEIKTRISASRLMVYDAAKKLGNERAVSEYASMCKWYVSEAYVKTCEAAMQIHGGNGYMEGYGIERCLRDAHASTLYSGTTEIQKNIIAKWNGL